MEGTPVQTTIVCKQQTTYVDTPPQLAAQHPVHCICCTRLPRQVRESNQIDTFALQYNVPPILAATLYQQTQRYNSDILNHNKPRITLEDYAHMIGMTPSPHGITPLYILCHDCGSTFIVLRSDPTTYKTTPLFCIYCASSKVTTQQADPEQTAFLSLAHHYDLTVPQIQSLFTTWQHQPKYTTFADFMHSDTLSQILPLMRTQATQA